VKSKRLVPVVVAMVGGGAFPGTASAGDDAATVNGVEISVADFEDRMIELGAEDVVPGDAVRNLLRQLVIEEAQRQFNDANGLEPDASAEQAPPPQVESVTEAYAQDRVSLGVVCARAIFVADEASQRAAVDALVGGRPFAEVGAEHSADPAFEATGGTLLGDPEQPCFDLAQLSQFPPDIAEALVTAPPRAVLPIDDPISVFVVPGAGSVQRPIAELYEGEGPGRYALSAFIWSSDVTIDPRYGRWNPFTATVVALGAQ
jgi:hypothetical protein